jgi:hypothetical protein
VGLLEVAEEPAERQEERLSHLLLQLTFLFDASFPLLPLSDLEKGQCLESSTEKCGPGQSHRGRR